MKVPLIALRPMTYATRRLVAGDTFDASPRDAKILKAVKRARVAAPFVVKTAVAAKPAVAAPIPAQLDHDGDGKKGGFIKVPKQEPAVSGKAKI